jgi:hypothetical protein
MQPNDRATTVPHGRRSESEAVTKVEPRAIKSSSPAEAFTELDGVAMMMIDDRSSTSRIAALPLVPGLGRDSGRHGFDLHRSLLLQVKM